MGWIVTRARPWELPTADSTQPAPHIYVEWHDARDVLRDLLRDTYDTHGVTLEEFEWLATAFAIVALMTPEQSYTVGYLGFMHSIMEE